MRFAILLTVLASAVPLLGCNTIKYKTNQAPSGPVFEEEEPFYICGLVGEHTVNLDKVCPGGVSKWYSQETFLDGLLACVTIGIYTPLTVHVECASGRAFELKQDPDTGRVCLRPEPRPKEVMP